MLILEGSSEFFALVCSPQNDVDRTVTPPQVASSFLPDPAKVFFLRCRQLTSVLKRLLVDVRIRPTLTVGTSQCNRYYHTAVRSLTETLSIYLIRGCFQGETIYIIGLWTLFLFFGAADCGLLFSPPSEKANPDYSRSRDGPPCMVNV